MEHVPSHKTNEIGGLEGVRVEIVAVTLSAHSFAGLGLAGVCVAGLDVLGGACEVFCRLWLKTRSNLPAPRCV